MSTRTVELKNYKFGPIYDEDDLSILQKEICNSYNKAWEEITQVLSVVSLSYGSFQIQWPDENNDNAKITISDDVDEDLLIYDIFLIANLASPGCFDPWHSSIDITVFAIDGSRFESSWLYARQSNLINITPIPMANVLKWYLDLDIGTRQTANTKVEKALFAVLHYCEDSKYCPSKMMWLKFALEALYDNLLPLNIVDYLIKSGITPVEGYSTTMPLLLSFYDSANQFATGKYHIHHPLENDFIDEDLNLDGEIIDLCRFALAIVIATLQKDIIDSTK